MYNEKVVDYFMHPRNAGRLEDANAVGEVGNPKCGDIMKMYLKIKNVKINQERLRNKIEEAITKKVNDSFFFFILDQWIQDPS